MNKMKPRRGKITQVKSGIGLSGMVSTDGTGHQESFLTSRTARVLLAGAGFLADAYDLFVINLVLRLLKDEYPQYAINTTSLHVLEGSVASAALVGSILGQLVAGSMADIIGRKKIFVATAALITIGSFGSAMSIDTPSLTIYGQICCWRFFLGAGVGGEYPLAATVTSESSSAGKRGALMSAVFAMQGVGSLLSGIVVYLCLISGCSTAFTWRFALAFGAVPALLAFPWRLRMHETESFEKLKNDRLKKEEHAQQIATIMDHSSSSHSSHPTGEIAAGTGGGGVAGGAGTVAMTTTTVSTQEDNDDRLMIAADQLLLNNNDSPNNNHNNKHFVLTSDGRYIYQPNPSPSPPPTTAAGADIELISLPSSSAANNSATKKQQPMTTMPAIMSPMIRPRENSQDYGFHYDISSRNNSNNYSYQPIVETSGHGGSSHGGGGRLGHNRGIGGSALKQANQASQSQQSGQGIGGSVASASASPKGSSNSRWLEILKAFKFYKYHMIGTALCWFLLDVDFYANGLFNHEITASILAPAAPVAAVPVASSSSISSKLMSSSSLSDHSLSATTFYNPYGGTYTSYIVVNSPASSSSSSRSHSSSSGSSSQAVDSLEEDSRISSYDNNIRRSVNSYFLASSDSLFSPSTNSHQQPAISLADTEGASQGSVIHVSKTTAEQDAINSMILSCIAIPGYLLSVFFIERVGRKNLQMLGFTMMAILFAICGLGYDFLLGDGDTSGMGKYVFLLIYSLTFLFSNFGPNTTTFVIPGEIYPAEVRATCHGLSAASGKLGAATGAYFFPLLLARSGSRNSTSSKGQGMKEAMYACSFIAILGVIVTYIFIPKYDSHLLAVENSYIALEHSCLQPTSVEEEMGLLMAASHPNLSSLGGSSTGQHQHRMIYSSSYAASSTNSLANTDNNHNNNGLLPMTSGIGYGGRQQHQHHQQQQQQPYKMLEIIQASHNYAMDEEEHEHDEEKAVQEERKGHHGGRY